MPQLYTCIFLLLSFITNAQDNNQINYQLTVTDAQHHLADVNITFPNISTEVLTVKLPVWRSGRYEILNLSKNINQFSAHNDQNKALSWRKVDKNTWEISLKQAGDVTINYQVYANTLKHRVAHIDETHAFLDASGVFMFSPELRDQPLSVELNVPDAWQSRSGMEKTAPHTFAAANYDQLVDSPIESGLHEFSTFQVDEQTYEIVIWGDGNHDINDLKDKVTLMHHEAKKIWGDFPYQRYVYMYHAGDGLRGATEHVNSTIIQQARFNFKPRKDYHKVLATTAHELVHTWNVKAYRPQGIAPYDYSKENYSELFWMAEGITSYYDDLFLLRTGIYKPSEYFAKLASDMHKHLTKPGRKVESLTSTSFDTWLKDDAQQTHNTSSSIYLEGGIVAWRMDQEIRQLSNHKYGMDELQLRLFQQHSNIDQGYNKNDVLKLLKDITGTDMTAFWSQYIDGTQSIDFDQLLNFYGLQKTLKKDDQKEDAPQEPNYEAWIGMALNLDGEAVLIKTVDSDSPAWQAGLNTGDQLLAINNIQVSTENIEKRLKQLSLVQPSTLTYFSAGRLNETQLTAITDPNPEFKIEPVEKPSKKQKARYKAWSGLDLIQD